MTQQLLDYLEKATFTTADLAAGGLLPPDHAKQFIRVAIENTVIIKEATNITMPRPKMEVPRVKLGSRVLRPGTEGARLADADRVTPATGLVTLSTVLCKGEIVISDEVLEDNIEGDRFADTIVAMLAEAVGRDVEELIIKGDTARTATEDRFLDLLDGIIKQCQAHLPASQRIDASTITSYDDLFGRMVEAVPPRYLRDVNNIRIYVPYKHFHGYRRSLAARGTGLGDQMVVSTLDTQLAFRGIRVVPVPMLVGTDTINGGAVDYTRFAILTDPRNIMVGWHREVRIERFRDPREGATSFIASLRVDVKLADPEWAVLAHSIAL
jgi:HK97 family phage major capsid protein